MKCENMLLTDEQREYAELAGEIARKELGPRVAELDKTGEFPMDVMEQLREAGFYGMDIPEKYGGMGFDHMTQAAVFEEIAKVDAGFSFNFALASGEFDIFEAAGASEEMKQYYADKILNGSICSFCLTESQAGSDASNILTTAKKSGDEYIINGTKTFITNGVILSISLYTFSSRNFYAACPSDS